jgi:hypothetical protein
LIKELQIRGDKVEALKEGSEQTIGGKNNIHYGNECYRNDIGWERALFREGDKLTPTFLPEGR